MKKLKWKQIGAPPTGSVWCGSNFNSGKNFNREVRGAVTKTQRGETVFFCIDKRSQSRFECTEELLFKSAALDFRRGDI